jgi:mandelamide amidase
VNAVSTTVLDLLAEAAVELVDVDIESIAEQGKDASMIIAMHEFPRDMMAYLRASGYDLALVDIGAGIGSPDVRASFEAITGAERPTDEQYRTALSLRDEARQRYARLVADRRLSALIQPTAPLTARPIGHDDTVELNGRQVPTFPTFVRHTDLAGTIGLPGISLPAGLAPSGLPVGIELGAAAGQDSTLLALAAAVERILPSTEPPQLESGLRPHVGACAAASDT